MADRVEMPEQGTTKQESFDGGDLMEMIVGGTKNVKNKLAIMKAQGSNISIGDMFEMQMLMNHLSQLSEMSSAVVSASNAAIGAAARAIK